jgi:hypothetical protein
MRSGTPSASAADRTQTLGHIDSPGVRLPPMAASSSAFQERVQFVLEFQATLFKHFELLVRHRLDFTLCAMHFAIDLVIVVEQVPKMRVVRLQFVNALAVLGELMSQIVLLVLHGRLPRAE